MIRAPVTDLTPGERRLDAPVSRYLARVLRLGEGDVFEAFDPASGKEADAVVLRAGGDGVTARFGPLRDGAAVARRNVLWIQGMAKADKCDAVVRDATELGATRLVVATTRRTVVKLDGARASARQSRWSRIAKEAARQSRRSEAPVVERPRGWAEALALAAAPCARFCLWEGAKAPLAPPLFEALATGAPLAFACGPEGGLDESEVALAAAGGWVVASLGPLALRTETVAAAVLGAVRVWRGFYE
jgi:16S rRNA (uracil1498-N3)-methyltransferase